MQYSLYHYCDPRPQVCGNRQQDFFDRTNPARDMKNHANKRGTLNLKVNGWLCSIWYIIVVIFDLKYVEIDTKNFLIARTPPEIWMVTKNSPRPRILRSTVKEATNIHWFFVILVLENVRNDTKINLVAWILPEIWCIMQNFSTFFKWRYLMTSPPHEDVSRRQPNDTSMCRNHI